MLTLNLKKKLRDFTLELKLEHNNGCLGILGPSGCGKSMGLKSMAGLITPDSGLIRLGGRIFYSSEKHINLSPRLRKTGYLFQNYALFPNMTVAQNVGAGISRTDKGRDAKITSYLERFQLSGLEHYYPDKLSGGQQQRTALARILASSPDLLLLDEPFSAMDAGLKKMLRLELLHVLSDYHGLSVLVTHDKDEVYQLCGSLIIMDQGRILRAGPTKEVFSNPGVQQAALLTGCQNLSSIQKLENRRLLALDWNLSFTTEDEIPDGTKAIGIRSSSLIPVSAEEAKSLQGRPEANLIPVNHPVLSTLPSEWEFRLDNSICWTVKKTSNSFPSAPLWLRVLPGELLMLS